MASTIVAVITDTHTGSTTAIAPPKFQQHTGRKDEVQTVQYNRQQEWLFACWRDFWVYVKELAGIRGKTRRNRLLVYHLGDMVENLHHGSVQVSNEENDQVQAFFTLFRPVVHMADKAYLTYGTTPTHAGEAASIEIGIAEDLGMSHAWELSHRIDGILFDLAHNGRAGQRDWTSAAPGLAVEVASDYLKDGKMPPRYVLRGHVHTIDDSGDKLPYTRAITLPSWQLRTAHGHKRAPNKKRSDIGGLIFDTAYPNFVNDTRLRYEAPGGFIKIEDV